MDGMLQKLATMVSVFTWPEFHGRPCKRRRVLSAVIKISAYKWLGFDSEAVAADFEKRFHRSAALIDAVFFNATRDEVHQERRQMARSRKFVLEPAEMDTISEHELFEQSCPPAASIACRRGESTW